MTTDDQQRRYITTAEFEAAINAIVAGLARVALNACHSYQDREQLAAALERDISGCKFEGPDRIAVGTVLGVLAKAVRNNTMPGQRWEQS